MTTQQVAHYTWGPMIELFTCKFGVTVVGDQLEPFAELNHAAMAESVVV